MLRAIVKISTTILVVAVLRDSIAQELNSEHMNHIANLTNLKAVNYFADHLRRENCDVPEDEVVPFNMAKRFGMYLAGYDYLDRPIWVVEFGRYDFRSVAEGSQDEINAFWRFLRQQCNIVFKYAKQSEEWGGAEWVFLLDGEGLNMRQLTPQTLSLGLQYAQKYNQLLLNHISEGVMFNANFVLEVLMGFMRPFFGEFVERFQVYGTNKAQWIPVLLERMPRESLPPWYGGRKDFKPIHVIGQVLSPNGIHT